MPGDVLLVPAEIVPDLVEQSQTQLLAEVVVVVRDPFQIALKDLDGLIAGTVQAEIQRPARP